MLRTSMFDGDGSQLIVQFQSPPITTGISPKLLMLSLRVVKQAGST
jgi:hypothetical protein